METAHHPGHSHTHSHDHPHSHGHGHSHGHHHHTVDPSNVNRAFIIGIVLNLAFVVIEAAVGFTVNSLSLLSDAGHNLADVASLAMALIAFRLVKVKPNANFTYGYKKTTILVALLNASILLLSIGAIGFEAIKRVIHPEPIPGSVISIVAAIGIVINTVTALLFFRNKDNDLNIKSAFAHLMADAIVSAGIVIGGIIIMYTHLYWIDAVLSIVIAAVILLSTWHLLKDSLRLSLDGVPEGIDLGKVRQAVAQIKGVKDFHHIHIWALSTTENALTGHVVIEPNTSAEAMRKLNQEVKHELLHMNVQHATIEMEPVDMPCKEPDC